MLAICLQCGAWPRSETLSTECSYAQEMYAVAEGIAEEMGGSLFQEYAPALAPAGKASP